MKDLSWFSNYSNQVFVLGHNAAGDDVVTFGWLAPTLSVHFCILCARNKIDTRADLLPLTLNVWHGYVQLKVKLQEADQRFANLMPNHIHPTIKNQEIHYEQGLSRHWPQIGAAGEEQGGSCQSRCDLGCDLCAMQGLQDIALAATSTTNRGTVSEHCIFISSHSLVWQWSGIRWRFCSSMMLGVTSWSTPTPK